MITEVIHACQAEWAIGLMVLMIIGLILAIFITLIINIRELYKQEDIREILPPPNPKCVVSNWRYW